MNLIGEKMLSEPLKELVYDMHQGINTVTEKVEYLSEGIPIIQSKHITKGYLHFNDAKFLSLEDYKKYHFKYQPQVDDLLVCNIGTIGKSLRVSEKNQFLIAWNLFLIKIKKEKLYSSFFAHYLNYLAHYKYFDRFLTGGTVKFINKKTMGNIPVPLPPLDQQKKIAAILDAADAYRQKTKALIEKYDELTQSLFLDMFGDLLESNDSLITLEELCGKGKYGSGASAIEFTEGSPRYIRITDINQDGSLNDKVVSPDELEMQYLLGKNDIVFARTGATVGKTYLYDEKDGDLVYAGYLIKFKIPEPYNAKYFFHFTKTEKYKAWVKNQQNVVAQPNINAKQYGNELKIPVPSLDLQNQFGERVQAIEAQKAQAQASLAQAEDLFNSLLQRAFKGELV